MLFERELGEGYPFHYRKGPSHKDGPLVCTQYFTFRTRKNRRYVVEAEQYQHHVYVLKYYPLALKASPNRFKLLVNDGDAFRILTTSTQIFLDICRRDPLASAGFVGGSAAGGKLGRYQAVSGVPENGYGFCRPYAVPAPPVARYQCVFFGVPGKSRAPLERTGRTDV